MQAQTITLNNTNTTGTWTAEFDRYEVARTLTQKQRSIFFTLGAEIGNNIAGRVGYQPDANRACAYAFWCGELIQLEESQSRESRIHHSPARG